MSTLASKAGTSSKLIRKQTVVLLQQYRDQPSIQLRNRIVELNMGLVRQVAHRLSSQSAIPYEDLEQLGSLGLIRAVERFDPNQGCAFSSFAMPYIRGEMLHFQRDHSRIVRIPRRWQTLIRRGQVVQCKLTTQLERTPTDAEIAVALGVTLAEWRVAQQSKLNYMPLSLDATLYPMSSDDQLMTLNDTLYDEQAQVRQTIDLEWSQLDQALSKLESQTRQILEDVYLKNITRKQIALNIGVSSMTISRRVKKGLADLSALMQA